MMPSGTRILVCKQPVDFRKAFDGLAAVACEVLNEDPQGGALFIFLNKRKNRLKVLWWDQTGFCLLYKRLHGAVFVLPTGEDGQTSVRIDGAALATLIAGQRQEVRTRRRAA